MIYFFERDCEQIILETGRHNRRFEIAVHHADGTTRIQASPDATSFLVDFQAITAMLREDRWRPRPARLFSGAAQD